MSEIDRLKEVVEKLRAEDGCPWDNAHFALLSYEHCRNSEAVFYDIGNFFRNSLS